MSRESLLKRASQLAQQVESDKGSASERGENATDIESENDSPFENDVEPIRDDTMSQSGELMTVTRAMRDVPDYLKPFAQCERRPRLKDICFANHPNRSNVVTPTSYTEARAAAAGTPMSAAESAPERGDMRPAAATSAFQSAPGREDARGAVPGDGRDGCGHGRRSRRLSRRDSRRAQSAGEGGSEPGPKNGGRERQAQDWAEVSRTQPKEAAARSSSRDSRSGQLRPVHSGHGDRAESPYGHGDWAESPSSSFQRRSSHGQQGGVELSSRPPSIRRGSSSSEHRESASQEPRGGRLHRLSSRSGPGPPHSGRGGGGADSLGTPLTQRTSEGREDRSGRGGDEQVVDSEREDPAGDVETVGEGHTEELSGGGSQHHQSLESALSSIPEDLRRTVHS